MLNYFPFLKKGTGIWAGSSFDSMIFPSLSKCIESRNYYADYFKKKYQIENVEEIKNNVSYPIILTKQDGLYITIQCPGKG